MSLAHCFILARSPVTSHSSVRVINSAHTMRIETLYNCKKMVGLKVVLLDRCRPISPASELLYSRKLQFFKLNGNQTENYIGKKKTFYFLQNV